MRWGWGELKEGGAHLRKWPCTVMSRPQAVTCKSPITCIFHRTGFTRPLCVCLCWVMPNLIITCLSLQLGAFLLSFPKPWIQWGEDVSQGLWHLLFYIGSPLNNGQGVNCARMTPFCCKDKSHYCPFKVSFSICIIVLVRKCLSLNFWLGLEPQSVIRCSSCSPIVHPRFPTMTARKAIFGHFNGRKWAPRRTRGTEQVCRREVLLYW